MMHGHGVRRIPASNVSPVSSIKLRTRLNIPDERERGSAFLIPRLRLRFVNLVVRLLLFFFFFAAVFSLLRFETFRAGRSW